MAKSTRLVVFIPILHVALFLSGIESQTPDGTLESFAVTPYVLELGIFMSGNNGAVCDHGFGDEEAKVACRELGFSSEYSEYARAVPGVSTGRYGNVLIDDVTCVGSESRLIQCTYDDSTIDPVECTANDGVGLRCSSVKLTGRQTFGGTMIDTYSNIPLIMGVQIIGQPTHNILGFVVQTLRANCTVSFQLWSLVSANTYSLIASTEQVLLKSSGSHKISVLGSEGFTSTSTDDRAGLTDHNTPACVTFEFSIASAQPFLIYSSGNNQSSSFTPYTQGYWFNFATLTDHVDDCNPNPCSAPSSECTNEYMTAQCNCSEGFTGPRCQYESADLAGRGECGREGPELDLVFLLEDSESAGNDAIYSFQVEMFRNILYSLYLLPRHDKVRVAGVVMSDTPNVLFELTEMKTKYEMDFLLLSYKPTNATNYNHTLGLEKALYEVLVPNKRPLAKGVIISFTHDNYTGMSDPLVLDAQSRRINVVSVSLQNIPSSATGCMDFIQAASNEDLLNKTKLVMERICDEPKDVFKGRNSSAATDNAPSTQPDMAIMMKDVELQPGRAHSFTIKLQDSNCNISFLLWDLLNSTENIAQIVYNSGPISFENDGFQTYELEVYVMLTSTSRPGFIDHTHVNACVSTMVSAAPPEYTLAWNYSTSGYVENSVEYNLDMLSTENKFSLGVTIDTWDGCTRCSPCQNNGTCQDTEAGYKCLCIPGFNGTYCENNIDDCYNHRCSAYSNCTDLHNDYRCDCYPGFYGQYCELVDRGQYYEGPPLLMPEQEREHVVIIQGLPLMRGRVHLYNVDYAREHCNISLQIWRLLDRTNDEWQLRYATPIYINPSPGRYNKSMEVSMWDVTDNDYMGFLDRSPEPCMTYVYRPLPNQQILTDRKSFLLLDNPSPGENYTFAPYQTVFSFNTFVTLDVLDDCDRNGHLCQNNATCADRWNNFTCLCLPGYTGRFCEQDIDECLSSPCRDRATCLNLVNEFECACIDPYNGTNCEVGFFGFKSNGNRIAPDPERHSAVVMVDRVLGAGRLDSFHFKLFRPWCRVGAQIWRNLNDTDRTLMLVFSTPTFQFDRGGVIEIPVWSDNFYVTENDRVGFLDRNDVPCVTFLYTHTEEEHLLTDWHRLEGQPDPVVGQNLTFYPYQRVYSFNFGALIDVVDDCTGNPCHVSATCQDLVNNYKCLCAPGTTGIHCTIGLDNCFNVTCPNNTTCVSEGDSYRCRCPEPFVGEECNIVIQGSSSIQTLTMDPATEAYRSIIISGTPLHRGHVIAFQAHLARPGCSVSFQIWRVANTTTNEYELNYTTPEYRFAQSGIVRVSVPSISISVNSDFRFGFLDRTPSPCVTYNYTTVPSEQVRTDWHDFESRSNPSAREILQYTLYHHTHIFSAQVEIDAEDDCASSPCLNDGTCVDQLNNYMCVCSWGWSGQRCEHAVHNDTLETYGFDVRNLTVLLIEPGEVSIIMEGVELPNGYIVAFQLSVLQANCRFRVQLWRRESGMDYTLTNQFEKTYAQPGVYRVDLPRSQYFLVTPDHKLGFASMTSVGACIAYRFVSDPAMFSVTRRYIHNSFPFVNQTYTFMPYQTTNQYGIMAFVARGAVRPPDRIVVINQFVTPGYEVMSGQTGKAVILTDVQPLPGNLLFYPVTLARSNCMIGFQLWRQINQVTNRWKLVFTTPIYTIPSQGAIKISVRHFGVGVSVADRLGFLDLSPSPCITYRETPGNPQTTVWADFAGLQSPRRGDEVQFQFYQRNFTFDIGLEIDTLLPAPVPGGQGPRGYPGLVGNPGDSGIPGIPGPRGFPGDKGESGSEGVDGYVLSKGLVGEKGIRGDMGLPGFPGIKGERGDTIKGEQGDAGPKGPDVIYVGNWTTYKGLPGDPGEIGSKGVMGEQGYTGFQGFPGLKGELGEPGFQGERGDDGIPGDLGDIGVPGYPGAVGDPGVRVDPFGIDWCAAHVTECQHGCVNDLDGGKCTCHPGYQLTNNNQCSDIDECSERNGLCQYICGNTMGSYQCSCPEGYVLSADNHRCNDVDECAVKNGGCSLGQLCVNLWGGHECLGPYGLTGSGISLLHTTTHSSPLVTDSMMIGLLVWLIIITIIIIVDILLVIRLWFSDEDVMYVYDDTPPEREIAYVPEREIKYIPPPEEETYYPKFFPRISMEDRDLRDWEESSYKRLDKERPSRVQTYDTVPYNKVSKLRRSGDYYFYGYPEN